MEKRATRAMGEPHMSSILFSSRIVAYLVFVILADSLARVLIFQ